MKNKRRLIFILCLPVLQLLPYFNFAQGINITSGGSIAVTGAATIEISNGNFVNNGTYTKGAETVTFSGTTSGTISGTSTTNIYNLTISNTQGIAVDPDASVTVSNSLNTSSGVLTILSNATHNGSLIAGGTYTVPSFLKARLK